MASPVVAGEGRVNRGDKAVDNGGRERKKRETRIKRLKERRRQEEVNDLMRGSGGGRE